MIKKSDLNKFAKLLPLCSIDLICRFRSKFLLVKRNNDPAKNKLCFVGGIIQKDQSIVKNIKKIAKRELNINIKKSQVEFSCFKKFVFSKNFNSRKVTTEYISLLHNIELVESDVKTIKLNADHSNFFFLTKQQLINDKRVLEYIKKIF